MFSVCVDTRRTICRSLLASVSHTAKLGAWSETTCGSYRFVLELSVTISYTLSLSGRKPVVTGGLHPPPPSPRAGPAMTCVNHVRAESSTK